MSVSALFLPTCFKLAYCLISHVCVRRWRCNNEDNKDETETSRGFEVPVENLRHFAIEREKNSNRQIAATRWASGNVHTHAPQREGRVSSLQSYEKRNNERRLRAPCRGDAPFILTPPFFQFPLRSDPSAGAANAARPGAR